MEKPIIEVAADGSVHIERLTIPLPAGISPEARAYLATSPFGETPPPEDIRPMWEGRADFDALLTMMSEAAAQAYPVTIEEQRIAGVRCHLVRPKEDRGGGAKLLINLHGGGLVAGSGSLIEAIPIAAVAGLPVLAVDYRLAPEHVFPAAVDDVVAVYRAMLERHRPQDIVIYGASAGSILTGQVIMRLIRDRLPLPACIGMFTGAGDLTDLGETARIFTLLGFWGHHILPPDHDMSEIRAYLGGHDPADPLLSPLKGDLSGFPPTLLLSGTRDALLSPTAIFHRALRRAGRDAELFVFEAMPHAHWYAFHLPESQEAVDVMARFFWKHLG